MRCDPDILELSPFLRLLIAGIKQLIDTRRRIILLRELIKRECHLFWQNGEAFYRTLRGDPRAVHFVNVVLDELSLKPQVFFTDLLLDEMKLEEVVSL